MKRLHSFPCSFVHSFPCSDTNIFAFFSFLFHCGKEKTNTRERPRPLSTSTGEMHCHNSVWVKTRFCYEWEWRKHVSGLSSSYSKRDKLLNYVNAVNKCRISSHCSVSIQSCIISSSPSFFGLFLFQSDLLFISTPSYFSFRYGTWLGCSGKDVLNALYWQLIRSLSGRLRR